jgi:phage tail-like protein
VVTIIGPTGREAMPGFDFEPVSVEPSRLLRYLPSIYEQDPFIGRFLRIFEDVHTPVRRMASTLPEYFDPVVAPPALQAILGDWRGEEWTGPLARLSHEARGRLIREALELHRWRGTRRGLRRALEIATGHTPLITDYGNGTVLSEEAHLGTNTRLEDAQPFQITVTFECDRSEVDELLVRAIIRRHRPAHVMCTVAFAGGGRD